MKQLIPTSLDEYIAEHKEGDVVTGRMTDVSGVPRQSGIGRRRSRHVPAGRGGRPKEEEKSGQESVDLSSLTSMLQATLEGWPGRRRSQGRRPAQRADPQLPHQQAGPGDEEDRTGARVNGAGRRPASLSSSRDPGVGGLAGWFLPRALRRPAAPAPAGMPGIGRSGRRRSHGRRQCCSRRAAAHTSGIRVWPSSAKRQDSTSPPRRARPAAACPGR